MKRLTYEFVKEQFENEGYELLSGEYVNQRQKLDYICPEGHRHSICWSDWNTGRRCYYCRNEKIGNSKRLDFEIVKDFFECNGYTLISKLYKNCDTKLEFLCPNGHKGYMSYHNFKSGWRCIKCRANRQRLICGPKHPLWKGGISCEPYCDAWADKEYKISILERDDHQCQNPDCWGTIKNLTIHHIDYNKKNCGPSNLITLCRSCNSRANRNREWHKNFYRIIMEKKYNFKEA
jgi:hypothetical protein